MHQNALLVAYAHITLHSLLVTDSKMPSLCAARRSPALKGSTCDVHTAHTPFQVPTNHVHLEVIIPGTQGKYFASIKTHPISHPLPSENRILAEDASLDGYQLLAMCPRSLVICLVLCARDILCEVMLLLKKTVPVVVSCL